LVEELSFFILDLPNGLENELRAEATRNGVSLHHQIIQNLASFNQTQQEATNREEELTQVITDWISVRQRNRYNKLRNQKESNRIADDEYQELFLLTNLIEVAHAVRMKHLFDLAAIRNTDVFTQMSAFGINNRAEYA
jgi:hypothetical protein